MGLKIKRKKGRIFLIVADFIKKLSGSKKNSLVPIKNGPAPKKNGPIPKKNNSVPK